MDNCHFRQYPLREGVPCATFWGPNLTTRVACVEGRGVSDGEWHVVFAERHGDNLIVYVDDGDGWRRNESLASLEWEEDGDGPVTLPPPLLVDKHEGVTVGGRPDLAGTKLLGVEEDLIDVCVDDLRVSGRPLPLPPVVNGTSWGQVTSARNIQVGCRASDPCTNTTCVTPLICTTSWGQPTCSCGPGLQASGRTCEDVDECVWSPCLHGATCQNLRPGYLCVCGPAYIGQHCQWSTFTSPAATSLTAPTAIAAVTASLILLGSRCAFHSVSLWDLAKAIVLYGVTQEICHYSEAKGLCVFELRLVALTGKRGKSKLPSLRRRWVCQGGR
ncbi:hypothetical protein Pmani_013307 [Petrolisthes manimaculis]|uniref:EGF-like domain-containing protein n=1 Tax=Petrolisthes manimaculis TaxID=1843537 RepID=A0AAE1PXN9_9EUCA|nr:hypothetical protein Pmani_013307 [Petrolisthes manimaculis]